MIRTRRFADREVVLDLWFIHGWTYREIAAAFGCSEDQVQGKVERARERGDPRAIARPPGNKLGRGHRKAMLRCNSIRRAAREIGLYG